MYQLSKKLRLLQCEEIKTDADWLSVEMRFAGLNPEPWPRLYHTKIQLRESLAPNSLPLNYGFSESDRRPDLEILFKFDLSVIVVCFAVQVATACGAKAVGIVCVRWDEV